jgi:periplasmic divalent cation tolerance protein
VVVLSTSPADAAPGLATLLVEKRLAACVNIIPGIESVYRWKGRVESAREHLLVIKTTASRVESLSRALAAAHPYAVPEVIAVPVTHGHLPYLEWVAAETGIPTDESSGGAPAGETPPG